MLSSRASWKTRCASSPARPDTAGTREEGPRPPGDRIGELDVLRGFAIAAVVGVHVGWAYTSAADLRSSGGRVVALFHLLSGFGVPLFLALSTAGLGLRHLPSEGALGHARFVGQRALRLLPAYLFWSLTSTALFHPEVLSSSRTVGAMLLSGTADWQFYFVPLLLEIYALWPLLRPVARASASSPWNAAAAAAAGLAASIVWWRLPAKPGGALLAPLFWLGYLVLGAAAGPYVEGLRRAAARTVWFIAAGMVTAATAWWMFESFLSIAGPSYHPYAVTIASMIFQVPPCAYTVSVVLLLAFASVRIRDARFGRILVSLGRHSYGVFLVHLVVFRLVIDRLIPTARWAVGDDPLATAGAALTSWIGCLALSTAAVSALSRTRWTRPLVSNRW